MKKRAPVVSSTQNKLNKQQYSIRTDCLLIHLGNNHHTLLLTFILHYNAGNLS